jgi:hypothetical protein
VAATAAALAPRVATAARAATAPRPVPAPRRVSGPRAAAASRGGAIAWPLPPLTRRQRRSKPAGSLPRRVGAFVVSLPDHPWLDRLVRGRAWIPVLGVLLAGIVATQVEILKLGASMGRAIEQTTTLTSENEQLRGSVAMLGDDQRIERIASAMGMVLPPPGAVGYLPAGPGGVSRALSNLHSPDPSAFVSLTPQVGDGALVTGQGASTLPPPSGEPTVSTPSATSSTSGASSSTGSGAAQSTTSASGSGQGATTTSTGPANTTEAPATTTQSPTGTDQSQTNTSQTQTDASQAPTSTGGQTTSSGTADQSGQATASGAAAIQPAGPNQQSGGG